MGRVLSSVEMQSVDSLVPVNWTTIILKSAVEQGVVFYQTLVTIPILATPK